MVEVLEINNQENPVPYPFIAIVFFLCVLVAIFPDEPELAGTRMSASWILLELRLMGGGGDNWSCKTCKQCTFVQTPKHWV